MSYKNEVLYDNNLSWAKANRQAELKEKPVENYITTLADIELLNIIKINVAES